MNRPLRRVKEVVLGAVLLVLGAASGGWWARHAGAPEAIAKADGVESAPQSEKQVLYWYDPMYPQQHFDKPGKSPFMDMELLPKYAEDGNTSTALRIDPAVTQNLGVRLANVTRIPLALQIDATGVIGFNERDRAEVQTRSGGFVERVWPLAAGDVIEAGQPLVELLVPEWALAQHEFLALRQGAGDDTLLAVARDRLRLLGMPEALIRDVEQSGTPRSRFTVTAPIAGAVQSFDVRIGMTVTAGQSVARINGLKTVWLEAAVPEAFASAIRQDTSAQVKLAGFPGQPREGRVTAILPALDETTRTLRVRIELPNSGGQLRPGLSAQVTLLSAAEESALAVPTEAVIRTGKRALVMVADEAGRFTPVAVTLGQEVGEQTVITAGLSEGNKVVASGQFLIDSEASLRGIEARSAGEPVLPTPPSLHQATATILGIDSGEISMDHGPFETLAMPGMTMSFPLAKPELAQGLKAGDQVVVFVRESESGLVVERIEKAEGGR